MIDEPRDRSSGPAESPDLPADAIDHKVPERRLYTAAMVHFFAGFNRSRDTTAEGDS